MKLLRALLTLLTVCVLSTPALAVTRYIDNAGSNSNNGTSTATPWLTWAHAFTNTSCGDTLIVMDGTYTVATNGKPLLTKVCTTGTVFTVQAQNQRAAFLSGNGLNGYEFRIINSAYVSVDGLRVQGLDNSASTLSGAVVEIRTSNHITWKNSIVSHPNRYGNYHVLFVSGTSDSLLEGNEIYTFHRHGLTLTGGASNNVVRRNYCNARSYDDIPGGYPSGFPGTGDDCFSIYTGTGNNNNVVENNVVEGDVGKGYVVIADNITNDNKLYGNIALGAMTFSMSVEGRGTTTAKTPQNTLIKDFVSINAVSSGLEIRGGQGTRCDNCSVIDSADEGFRIDKGQAGQEGATPRSFYSTGLLLYSNTGIGYSHDTTDVPTWTNATSNANSNGTNWSPSSHANYDPDSPSTAAPGMASCYLWAPDSSAADTNSWGAEILYRYVDGILTTTPLWDPTTLVFPHGATVIGVNDIDGSSPYNVHVRLHVGVANGCAVPASFTPPGTTPQNPANYTTGEGTSSTTFNVSVSAGMDFLGVCVALWDAAGNVGTVSGITSGGEALTVVTQQTNGYRGAAFGYKLAPTSGTRSVVVSTAGTVTGMVTTAMTIDDISAVNTVGGATGSSTIPSVTAPTNTSETIVDCLSSGKVYALTAGVNQTLQRLDSHTTELVRLATSTQSGTNGGVMDYINGGSTIWALVALSLVPTSPDPHATATLTQSIFRWHGLYGTEAAPNVLPFASAANNVNIKSHTTGMARVRMEVTGAVAATTPTSVACFCSTNSGAYAKALDTFGSNAFRLYGAGAQPDIPSSSTATTQLLNSGNFVTGAMIRDQSSVYTIPALTTGQHVEVEWTLVFNGSAGDTIDCRVYKDSGTALDTYTVTPRVTLQSLQSGMGF